MTIKRRKMLAVVPACVATAMLAGTAVAYACTTFIGTFSVTGSASGTVTSTGTGMMTQTVTSTIAKSHQSLTSSGALTVSTGANGSAVLPAGTYDVNFYNSDAAGQAPGYTNHTTWTTDCMDSSGAPVNGTKLGSVTVSGGVITGATGGTYNSTNHTVAFSNVPDPNLDISPQESAVCVSDSAGSNGNEAPLTIIT